MQELTTDIDYKSLCEQLQTENAFLKQELAQLKKIIFGSKQERFVTSDAVPLAIITQHTGRSNSSNKNYRRKKNFLYKAYKRNYSCQTAPGPQPIARTFRKKRANY